MRMNGFQEHQEHQFSFTLCASGAKFGPTDIASLSVSLPIKRPLLAEQEGSTVNFWSAAIACRSWLHFSAAPLIYGTAYLVAT